MHEIILPRLGFTMVSGVVERWHKKEGDRVEKGDILFEVTSDKVTVEVESVYDGYLRKIIGKEGEELPVNSIVGYIGGKDEEIPQRTVSTSGTYIKESTGTKTEANGSREKLQRPRGKKRVKVSPLARKVAKELGIDYENEPIQGTGPEGRISKEDILAYAKLKESGEKAPKATSTILQQGDVSIMSSTPLTGIRKVIAEKMSYSHTHIPHLTLNAKVDSTQLVKRKEELSEKVMTDAIIKLTYSDFLIKICASALRKNRTLNSSLQNNNFIVYNDINVGLAVSTGKGLIVPTFYQCDQLGLVDIAKRRNELVVKAREGKLSYREITNGTFTITNLGMFGVRSFSAIINPPQAAILAVGELYQDPAVVDDKIEIRYFIDLSLSCDHRIIDGDIGAQFLQSLVAVMQDPGEII
jgi:pyruvate dehydrogenase E2 component (dihydrolipoamide acetyltransferase)